MVKPRRTRQKFRKGPVDDLPVADVATSTAVRGMDAAAAPTARRHKNLVIAGLSVDVGLA